MRTNDQSNERTPMESTETITASVPAPTVIGAAAYAGELAAWTDAVRDTEARCVEHAFGAAVASIALIGRGGLDDQRRRALAALAPLVRATDVVGATAADEIAVLIVPVETITDAHDRVLAFDRALTDAGISAAVGWAMRLDDHGLFHAAARADAALATARRRHRDSL